MAAIDSLSLANGGPMRDKDEARSTRRVNGHTFVLHDGVWTDVRYHAGMPTTKIKPFSKAYFDLLQQVPELRAVFALGDRVIVVGTTRAIRVDDTGVAELTPALRLKAW